VEFQWTPVEKWWNSSGIPLEKHWNPWGTGKTSPWRATCRVPSTTNRQGDEIIGAPKHPDWLTVVHPPSNGEAPRVLAYVHNRLTWLRPSLRRDLIDHRNILILSLFSEGRTINIMRSLLSPTDSYRTPTDSIEVLEILLSIQKL